MDLRGALEAIFGLEDKGEEEKFKKAVKQRMGERPETEDVLALKFATVLGDYEPNVEHVKLMVDKAIEENIDPSLVMALVAKESSFDERAKNYNRDSTDYGYFQLNDKWHDQHRANVEKHIEAGIEHLKWCLDTANGDEERALSRYNTGSENSSIGRRYARDVLRLARDISRNMEDVKRI